MLGFINLSHPDYADATAQRLGKDAAAALRAAGIELFEIEEIITERAGAFAAARRFVAEDVDGIILFYGAFVLCPTVMDVICESRLPILHWAVPMMIRNGLLSTTGSYVALSMFNGTLERLGIPHENLIAAPTAEKAVQKVTDFVYAASSVKLLRRMRIGLVGYTSMSIYPGTFDHVLMRWKIGPEIEHFDSYTLINRAEAVKVTAAAIARYEEEIYFPQDASELMKQRAAKLYIALRDLCKDFDLDAITVKCQYEFSKEYGMTPCLPLSLLAEDGIVTACEGDIPCMVSCAMLNLLTGTIVSYGDVIHHEGNTLKLSPCGFMPFSLGNPGKKETFVSAYPYFKGVLCSFVMHPGKMTMMRLVETQGGYQIMYFTGNAIESELRGGNMPSVDIELDGDIEKLIERYPGQHFAIAYGDSSNRIEMMAKLLGIETIRF